MIHHVALETRRDDAEACAAFFGLIGFTPVDPPGSLAERALWLQAGQTQVHLLYADDPVVPGQGHVAVVVEDYEAVLSALRGAGHVVEPRPAHWGSPRAFAYDPAGHRVELMAFPPNGERAA
jgi:catechol 2,3-dioxygenase-like lactoylglutathione lyase family enzyme